MWPCFAFGTLACSVSAQDSLRTSLNGQTAAAQRAQELENQPYTVKLGDFKLLASATAGVDYNDNITLLHNDPKSDVILRPMSQIDALWPITDLNSLSFSLGAGYEAYTQHSEYNRAVITPGSQLGWDIFIKDFRLNLHDQFSYEQDPTANGEITGNSSYGGFYNTAGLSLMWDLKDVTLSWGYDHSTFTSSSSKWEYLNRASDFGWFRSSFKVHPAVTTGLELSGGPTSYDSDLMNDNMTYSVGAFANWKVTKHITVEPRVGYYTYFFDSTGTSTRKKDEPGYYFSLRMTHAINQYVKYVVEGGRETFFGVASALTDQLYGTAYINWKIIKRLNLSTGFRYEDATQPVSFLTEDYNRMSVNLKMSYALGAKLSAGLDYRYWLRDSQLLNLLSYEQNRVNLSLTYRF